MVILLKISNDKLLLSVVTLTKLLGIVKLTNDINIFNDSGQLTLYSKLNVNGFLEIALLEFKCIN